jgi:hypothetical protein
VARAHGFRASLLLLLGAVLLLMFAPPGSGSSSSKHRRVTLKAPGVPNKVRPSKVYTSEASLCQNYATHLKHWHHWGASSTNSQGRVHYSTGQPDCARGSRLVHGRVGLSHIHRCGDGLHYGRVHFVALTGVARFGFAPAEGLPATPTASKQHPIYLACGTRREPFAHPNSLRIRPPRCVEAGDPHEALGCSTCIGRVGAVSGSAGMAAPIMVSPSTRLGAAAPTRCASFSGFQRRLISAGVATSARRRTTRE